MVLLTPRTVGGAPRRGPHRFGEAGSQAIEFALLLPAVALVAAAVGLAGLVGADLVAAQTLARDAARHAAAGDPGAAHAALAEAAPGRHDLVLEPPAPAPGEPVTARVRLRPRALPDAVADAWLPEVEATMRAEAP